MQTDLLIDANHEHASSMLPPATGSSNINVGPEERVLSAIAGAALGVYGLRHITSLSGLTMTLAGGMLLYRGLTGYCAVNNALGRTIPHRRTSAMEANVTLSINKPRSEVYAYWRTLENLPSFMKHLAEVKVEDSVRSVWKANVPGGLGTVTWESVITEDRPGELISWSTLPGSTIDSAGEITFEDAPNGFETIIKVKMDYRLPGGDVGSLAGKLFNPAIENMIRTDIKRFKSILETGELPASEQASTVPSSVDTSFSTGESSSSETGESKPKKSRQSRKKTNVGLDSPTTENFGPVDETDLLERP
jgi:uncharacterized membrane protein